jgi:hypothetical protein
VAADRQRRRDRTRHRHYDPAQRGGGCCGTPSAAAHAGLHYDGAGRERGDQPVADQEAVSRWPPARWILADYRAAASDPVEQPLVACWVGPIQATGLHRNSAALGGERAPVRGTVDAERGAGDHGKTAFGKFVAELSRDVLPVSGRGPGPYHRHRPLR